VYVPKHFEETDRAVLHALIDTHPLGAWITHGADGLAVDHIPFLVDRTRGEFGTLLAHVAKVNPVWRALDGENESVVVFRGADAYVSPAWYPAKHEHGRVVPTWNYAVVHAFGRARAIHDPAWLRDLLERLVARHESSRPQPWQIADAPADYIARQLEAIVGIELPIRRIEGKWKASQNRSRPDRLGVVAGLAETANGAAMSQLVLERLEAGEPR
jgi:transcriptional regulator